MAIFRYRVFEFKPPIIILEGDYNILRKKIETNESIKLIKEKAFKPDFYRNHLFSIVGGFLFGFLSFYIGGFFDGTWVAAILYFLGIMLFFGLGFMGFITFLFELPSFRRYYQDKSDHLENMKRIILISKSYEDFCKRFY